jgi:hypothetical protein
MDRVTISRILVVPAAIVFAGSIAACNGNRANSNARGHEGAPIDLTGCLQKGGGMTASYVLTQVNEPTRSVGTTGSTGSQGAVAQEQMREARHAYRLDGDNDQLDNLVGKQVRVQGVVAENSDLNKRAEDNRRDTDRPADLDTSDLAKVNVQSISAVSDSCGSGSGQPK